MPAVPITANSRGDNIVIAGVPNSTLRIAAYVITVQGSVELRWYSGSSSGKLLGALVVPVISFEDQHALPNQIVVPGYSSGSDSWYPASWFDTLIGDPLILNLSDNVQVFGHLTYFLGSPAGYPMGG